MKTINADSIPVLGQLYIGEATQSVGYRRQVIQGLARKTMAVHVALMEVDPDRASSVTDLDIFAAAQSPQSPRYEEEGVTDMTTDVSWGIPVTRNGKPNGDRVASKLVTFVEHSIPGYHTAVTTTDGLEIVVTSPGDDRISLFSFVDELNTLEDNIPTDPLDVDRVPDNQFNDRIAGYDKLLTAMNSALGITPPELTIVDNRDSSL